MGARAKVFCSLIIFFIVFGLRIFCANCQMYPQQQPHHRQQMQIQTFQQQLQAVTIPIQKDLLSKENRLQSQVRLCSRGPLVVPCPKRFRKPFFFMLPVPVPVHRTVQTTASTPQVFLRPGASLLVPPVTPIASAGQKEHYSDWSHNDPKPAEDQQANQTQRRPTKNCKRKRRPQVHTSTTDFPLRPSQQYWRGHVDDEHLRVRQAFQNPIEPSPTQDSERFHEPSTTKFSARIGEVVPSKATKITTDVVPTQHSQATEQAFSSEQPESVRRPHPYASEHPESVRRPQPTVYSEKIREFDPTMESLIARRPITSTVFDKIQEPAPTRISERSRESFSTKQAEPARTELSPPERVREKKPTPPAKVREAFPTRGYERVREPLAALEQEQKLSELRDKHRQDFVAGVTAGYRDKSYRRPYSQAKKESTFQPYASKEEPDSKPSPSKAPIDLKEILKNSGGLSLVEILQQKNLSLDDLIKGKQNALLALQTTASAPRKEEESKPRERLPKPIRRATTTSSTTTTTTTTTTPEPPVANDSAENSSNQSEESQELSSSETISKEVVKDVATIRKNLKYPSRLRLNTTTRRQLFETTVQQKFSTTTTSTTTTARPSTTRIPLYKKRQHTRPSLIRAPTSRKPDMVSSESKESRESSSSQEDNSVPNYPKRSRFRPTTSTTTESNTDPTDPASNIVEDSGENEILLPSASPENTSFSTENNTQPQVKDQKEAGQPATSQEEPTSDHIYRYNSLKNYIDNNLPHAVFMDIDLADVDPVDDRTDLLELIEDRRSGNRLIKVLEQRNMTLEELIEHRKRGSSQLHLATFVQNKSGVFPGKKVVVNDDMDIVTAFENFPHFNLLNLKSVKPDEIKTDSQGSSYFTSIIDIEPTDEALKDSNDSKASPPDRKNSIRNPSSSTNIQRQPFYPSWKSLALASLTSAENARRFLQRSDPDPPQQTAQRHQSTVIEEDPILQIEDQVARAHDLVDLELSGHGFKRSAMNLMHTSQMPPGIRSAIVASAAIVLTSLVTFMLIFVACRWKQRRRRRKLDYMETYNAMKNKLPVISSRKTDELDTSTTSLGLDSVPSRVSRSSSRQSHRHQISIVFPGETGDYPLSVPNSRTSANPKLASMSPSSPEVQKYLFDALHDSF